MQMCPNLPAASDAGFDSEVIAATRIWLERAVIGLNLCPFAKGVHVKEQIHYVVSHGHSHSDLLACLVEELRALNAIDPSVRDTTLLIVPCAMVEFLEFTDFLRDAGRTLRKLHLHGVLQIASFHPLFQFAGTGVDDITNFTNRSPYPTLHLLREDSIERAVAVFPEAEAIYEKNMETLAQLGHAGWKALGLKKIATTTDRSSHE